MKTKIFAVYDSAVGCYMQPFFMQSKGQAIRAWMDTVNDPKTQFHAHPADFTLFELGDYDEETGILTNLPAKLSLGTALEHKARSTNSIGANTLPSPADPTPAERAKTAVLKHSERNMQ